MVKGKHRYYAKWRTAAPTVGFLTLVYVASAHAQGSGYIYWMEAGTSKIRRANLDGTNLVDLVTGASSSIGIALQFMSSSSSGSQVVRYVPFRSQYVVLALFALLGCWYILRPH